MAITSTALSSDAALNSSTSKRPFRSPPPAMLSSDGRTAPEDCCRLPAAVTTAAVPSPKSATIPSQRERRVAPLGFAAKRILSSVPPAAFPQPSPSALILRDEGKPAAALSSVRAYPTHEPAPSARIASASRVSSSPCSQRVAAHCTAGWNHQTERTAATASIQKRSRPR